MSRTLSLLSRQGFDIVFVTKANVAVMRDLLPDGVTVAYVSADNMWGRFLGTLLAADERPKWWMRAIRKTLHLLSGKRHYWAYEYAERHLTGISEERFDAVLDFEGYGFIETVIGTHLNAPVRATWVHDENLKRLALGYPYLVRYDRIFCVSHAVQAAVAQRYPQLADRTRVLLNPVDADAIRRQARMEAPVLLQEEVPTAFRLVTVCRLVPEKNLELSMQVAAALRDRGLEFVWEVFGEGPDRGALQNLIDRMNLSGRFVLRGAIDNPYPSMAQADVYVQTSGHEGFGLAVQEAKILGVPVVVTDIPAFREQVVDGQTGFIRPPDATVLADVIIRLAGHPEERRRIAENLAALDWTDAQDESPLFEFLGLE
ncbi:glycosyltransferase [Bifidobacterium scaligerum]|nr:glycosyltransferase [Bifidobacterium scaligerum]